MAMQKLNVRFSNDTKEAISKTACDADVLDSHVARAAINLGLGMINQVISNSTQNDVDRFIADHQK